MGTFNLYKFICLILGIYTQKWSGKKQSESELDSTLPLVVFTVSFNDENPIAYINEVDKIISKKCSCNYCRNRVWSLKTI